MVKRALILVTSIIIALPLLMPFNIYANATHQVQTDYLSSVSSEWKNSMVFTSYCEGTNANTASCVLTVNITKSPKNYFGSVTIHGYDSSGTKWINYGDIFVSAGTGVYNYNFYQNGIKEISRVEVYSTNLVQPSSTVDLSQIIQLLTSINNYENQNNVLLDELVDNTDTIENNQLTAITEIRNVLSQLVISNGYLETLTKIRDWNIPFESIPFVTWQIYNLNKNPEYYPDNINNFINTCIFRSNANDRIGNINTNMGSRKQVVMILGTSQNIASDSISNFFTIDSNYFDVEVISLGLRYFGKFSIYLNKYIFTRKNSSSGPFMLNLDILQSMYYEPVYLNYSNINTISTEFALRYSLSNRLLDDLNIIANGTVQSNSVAQSSDSANSQLQTDSNTLFQQENGFKSDMNNAMQNVNNTFRLQDMGTKFVSSAHWVRSQYESLTNNTPFASLITFSLITGLALILLGKVYK